MNETNPVGSLVSAHRGWFMATAVALIVLGMLCVAMPLAASVAIDLLLGWLLVLGGAVKLAHAFAVRSWKGFALQLLSALLFLIVGFLLVTQPLQGVLTLTLLLAALLIIEGVFKIVTAIGLRPAPVWSWVLFSGVVTLVLGGLIGAQWPSSAEWVIGLLVGIDLLFSGWSMLFLGLSIRREAPAAA